MKEVEPRDRNGRPRLSQTNFRVPSSRSSYGNTPEWVEKATKDFLDSAGDAKFDIAIKKMPYTKPKLRESIKNRIMAGSNGGRPGQWSARKAQLLAQEYRRAGGGYRGKPGRTQRSLKKWTKERWTTSDGKPANRNGRMTRYLPAAAWKRLTPAQRRATIAKKLSGDKRGRQFVPNTERAASASKRIRSKTLGPSVGEVTQNPNGQSMFIDKPEIDNQELQKTKPENETFNPDKSKLSERDSAIYYGEDEPVKPFIRGNVEIDNRQPVENQSGNLVVVDPVVVDGSGDDVGMFVIVPRVTKFGQIIDDAMAKTQYEKTGDNLGKFKTSDDAHKYMDWLKEIDDEISYRDKKRPITSIVPLEKIASETSDGFEYRRRSISEKISRLAEKYLKEKALGPGLRVLDSVQIYDPDAVDADNDGFVQDATPWMRPSLPSSPIIAGLRSARTSKTPTQRAVKESQEFLNLVSQYEPDLTEQMKKMAGKKNSSLYLRGLKNRQKSVESLALKAQRLQHLFDNNISDTITSMNDPLRYTFESDDLNKYTNDVLDTVKALTKIGHKVTLTNYWTSGDPYRGVNAMVEHPAGFFYEIQFHTPASYRLRNKLTPLYQKYRDEKNLTKRQAIYDEMLKASKGISIPKDIGKFDESLKRGSAAPNFLPKRPAKLIATPLEKIRRKPDGMGSSSRIDFLTEETARQKKLLNEITTEQFKEKWGELFDILGMNLELSDSEIILKNKKDNNLLSRAGLDGVSERFIFARHRIAENPLNYNSLLLEQTIDAIDKFALDGEKKEFVLNQAKEVLRLRKLFENSGQRKGADIRPMNRDFISTREFVKTPYRGAWIYPDGKIYPVFFHADEHNYDNSFEDGIVRLDTARVVRQGGKVSMNLEAKIKKLTPSQIETVAELYESFGQPELHWEIQGHYFIFDGDGEIRNQSKAARQKILKESLGNDIYTNLTSVGGMSSRRRDMTDEEKARFQPLKLEPDEKAKLQPGTTLVYADEDDRIIRTELIGPQVARVRGIPGLKLYTDPSPDNQNEVDARMREWDEVYGPVDSPQRQARGGGGQPDRTAREQSRPRTTNEDPIDRILREAEETRNRRGGMSSDKSPEHSIAKSYFNSLGDSQAASDLSFNLLMDREEIRAAAYSYALPRIENLIKEGKTGEEISSELDLPLLGIAIVAQNIPRNELNNIYDGEQLKSGWSKFKVLDNLFRAPRTLLTQEPYSNKPELLGIDIAESIGVDKLKAMSILAQVRSTHYAFTVSEFADMFDIDLATAVSAKYRANLSLEDAINVAHELNMTLREFFDSPLSDAMPEVRVIKSLPGSENIFLDALQEEVQKNIDLGDSETAKEIMSVIEYFNEKFDTDRSNEILFGTGEMNDDEWLDFAVLGEVSRAVLAGNEDGEAMSEDIVDRLVENEDVQDIADSYQTSVDDIATSMLGFSKLPSDEQKAGMYIYRALIPENPGLPESNTAKHVKPMSNSKIVAKLLNTSEEHIAYLVREYVKDNNLPVDYLLEGFSYHGINSPFVAKVLGITVPEVLDLLIDKDIEHSERRLMKGFKRTGFDNLTRPMRLGRELEKMIEEDNYSIEDLAIMMDMEVSEVDKLIKDWQRALGNIRKGV